MTSAAAGICAGSPTEWIFPFWIATSSTLLMPCALSMTCAPFRICMWSIIALRAGQRGEHCLGDLEVLLAGARADADGADDVALDHHRKAALQIGELAFGCEGKLDFVSDVG